MDAQIPWHRQFGLTWEDFFRGLPIAVEMEKDLSLKQQFLDLVLVRQKAVELPHGATHYRPRSPETSTLLYQLFERYRREGVLMPDALEQLYRETIDAIVQDRATLEAILRKTAPEERLKGLPAEERLKGLPAEERLKGLSADELLAALPPEMREELARRLRKENGSTDHPAGAS
jgi:hypothetical protein